MQAPYGIYKARNGSIIKANSQYMCPVGYVIRMVSQDHTQSSTEKRLFISQKRQKKKKEEITITFTITTANHLINWPSEIVRSGAFKEDVHFESMPESPHSDMTLSLS